VQLDLDELIVVFLNNTCHRRSVPHIHIDDRVEMMHVMASRVYIQEANEVVPIRLPINYLQNTLQKQLTSIILFVSRTTPNNRTICE
jgi:nicotinic acid mononucleotide adenylyltransferase